MIRYESINPRGAALCDTLRPELADWQGEAIVFVGALGICVRKILPSISDNHPAPAAVCIDTCGRSVIPVLSGHIGGANALAQRIAEVIGATAVVTTQSDNAGLWALDTLARTHGWGQDEISPQQLNDLIFRYVGGKPTRLCLDWPCNELETTAAEHVSIVHNLASEADIIFTPRHILRPTSLVLHPRVLHLGVGCQKMAPAETADEILRRLEEMGWSPQSISTINTIDIKRDEPCIERLQALLPWARLRIHQAEDLRTVSVPNPSERVMQTVGCWGVAEASALINGSRMLVPKTKGSIDGSHHTFALAAEESGGHVEIVGAGPGDPDLVSVRGRRFLEQADLILYAGSLVPRALCACAKPGAVVRNSAPLNLQEQISLMKAHYDRGQLVVRLHTGDPSIYGAIEEQMAEMDRLGMRYHITPGISSFLAAAAELQSQFTIPERCQTIILTRGEGRTKMPEREKLQLLAAHGSTMCIFLSATLASEVQEQLLAGGAYTEDTPVAVCSRLTWQDQLILRGRLADLASIIRQNNLTLTTMIVVGDAIGNREGLSRLYAREFTHLYRDAK